MKKLVFLLLPFIGFSQECENSILDNVLQNSDVNQYFQIALSLNIQELEFLNNCDTTLSYTMFVPGNDVPNESVNTLLTLDGEFMDYIPYYIYEGSLSYSDLVNLNGSDIIMNDGNSANINYYDGPFINQSMLTISDLCACNGIIHVIDDLIWAPGVFNFDIKENNNSKLHYDYFEKNVVISDVNTTTVIKITDLMGRVILFEKITTPTQIKLENYQKGCYFINIFIDDDIYSKKIIIN